MKDQPKISIWKKLFGQKSGCCSIDLEEYEKEGDNTHAEKGGIAQFGCCSSKISAADSSEENRDREE